MAFSGTEFLVDIENPSSLGTYITVGGGRSASVSLDGGPVVANDFIGQISELAVPNTGVCACRVSGSGLFVDSAGEEQLLQLKMSCGAWNFRIRFANSRQLVGSFYVTQFSRSGDMSAAEGYSFALVGHNIKASSISDRNLYSLALDGTSDAVCEIADTADHRFTSTESFSLEAWVKISSAQSTSSQSNTSIAGKGFYGQNNFSYGLRVVNNGGGIAFWLRGGINQDYQAIVAVSRDAWAHVCGTYNHTTGIISAYIDGVFSDDTSSIAAQAYGNNSKTFIVGMADNAPYCMVGKVDNVRLYRRVLSADEIAEHAIGVFNDESGLELLLKFSEGGGSTTADTSSNAATANLSSGATFSTDCPVF